MAAVDDKRTITRKRYKIDTYFLLKSNRKLYVLYQMVMFPMTPPTTPIFAFFAFFVAFHIFVVSKHRDFIFGVQVDRG